MLKYLLNILKESLLSTMPITFIVLILYWTRIVNLSHSELIGFLVSAFMLVIGMSLFSLGTNQAMLPIGESLGASITKRKKLFFLIAVIFLIGVIVTVAEPSLILLAQQVPLDTWTFVMIVALGVGVFLVIGIIRILFQKRMSTMLIAFYGVIFALVYFSNKGYIPMAFDASGVTTGLITVPFVMAIGTGVAHVRGGKQAHDDSFGLIGMASIGPILLIVILGILIPDFPTYQVGSTTVPTTLLQSFVATGIQTMLEIAIVLLPIVIFFFVYQAIFIRLPKQKIIKISVGLIYTFFGLVLFMTGANVGYLPIGRIVGQNLNNVDMSIVIVIIAFVMGALTAFAEPAVHVLGKRVEDVTGGTIRSWPLILTLSLGVGVAITLSVIRILFKIDIMIFLFIGYFLALGLSLIVPKIYTSIAFDSGGAVSGPMTSAFLTPLIIGFALDVNADVMLYGFGMVAFVAMMPLISVQLLGFNALVQAKVRQRIIRRRIAEQFDDEIIYFNVGGEENA